jgi:6-phosphogluconolactonase
LLSYRRAHLGTTVQVALLTVLVSVVLSVPVSVAGTRNTASKSGTTAFGEVYTLTNNTGRNAVLEFERLSGGALDFRASYATGGKGGTQIERGCIEPCPFIDAQNEVILGLGGHYLFAVNPGSNTVSSFRVTSTGLKLVGHASSGGRHPVSLTAHGDLLYVLNDGTLTISGLHVSATGKLTPIKGSTQKLSAGAVTSDLPPKQIQFDNSGTVLVVTLLAVPVIDTFKVDTNGVAGGAIVNRTAHPLPCTFSIDSRNRLAVSEIVNYTMPPNPGAFPPVSVVSTYGLDTSTGKLRRINTAPEKGFAAGWTAIAKNGRHEYVVNTGAGAPSGATVSVMHISPSGHVSLAQVSPPGAPGPLSNGQELIRTDDALTGDNKYLYVVVPGVLAPASKIDEFEVLPNGHIAQIGATAAIPDAGLSALAAS